ncbi:MAG: Flagellum-specific synthase FliI [Frankiales bacterium]|nr:Flagellum-specific synthase FliI [Frankiales bacterium]
MTTVAALLAPLTPWRAAGTVSRVVGLEAECRGLRGALGDLVSMRVGDRSVPAQVVAVREDALLLAPYGDLEGVSPGAAVERTGSGLQLRVGDDLVGRVVDALGRPIDDGPPLAGELVSLDASAPHPLKRQRISEPLPLGVRCLDTMTPCGRGQRIGIFAGSGVGKSTLMGMMARGTEADVVVVGLVGERGREVREFLEDDLGPGGREKVVCVVATSDEPPLMRLRAAYTATRIAEHFRDQGLDVLLLVDSLTRFAMARREIGLAAGEPPATRGYPPSVFAELPRLLERAGPGETGTITAIYTVLVEGDDMNDPVADNARGILDGHVVLSRKLAAAGHFPTVDVLDSVSRSASKVTPKPRLEMAARLRRLLAAAAEAKDLVEIGAYVHGSDPLVDEALARRQMLNSFLRQPVDEVADPEHSWEQLAAVLA